MPEGMYTFDCNHECYTRQASNRTVRNCGAGVSPAPVVHSLATDRQETPTLRRLLRVNGRREDRGKRKSVHYDISGIRTPIRPMTQPAPAISDPMTTFPSSIFASVKPIVTDARNAIAKKTQVNTQRIN